MVPRLIHNRPGSGVLRECLAQVRYVAAAPPARKKAIVGKSRIAATGLQGGAAKAPQWLELVHDANATSDLRKLTSCGIRVSGGDQAKRDLQLVLFSPLKPYLPTRQAPGTQEDLLALPNSACRFCPPSASPCRDSSIAPLRGPGQACWSPDTVPPDNASQRFAWTLPVKLLSPQLQRLWRGSLTEAFQLFSDVPMQPFVPSVILRMRRSTSFQIDPQRHPPRRQPAQPVQGLHAGKAGAA